MADLRMHIESAAQVAHEAVRALAASTRAVQAPLVWDRTTDWVRSAMIGEIVEVLEDPDGKSRWLNWSRVQRTHGWRHGTAIDGVTKTDPRLTSTYETQPAFYIARDRVIEGVVDALRPWLR